MGLSYSRIRTYDPLGQMLVGSQSMCFYALSHPDPAHMVTAYVGRFLNKGKGPNLWLSRSQREIRVAERFKASNLPSKKIDLKQVLNLVGPEKSLDF